VYRDALRAGLALLQPGPGEILHAVYSSPDPTFCDVENITIFNLGPAQLRHLARDGLCVERSFDLSSETPINNGWGHQMRYTTTSSSTPFRHWTLRNEILRFDGIQVPTVSKPAKVWSAIRQHAGPPPSAIAIETPAFGISLTITAPAQLPAGQISLASVVKHVLDGIISALHAHSGAKLAETARRLSTALDLPEPEVRAMLTDPRWAALGSRQLAWPFGNDGVQWNPADDRCQAIRLLLDTAGDAHHDWQLSGSIFTIDPLHDPNSGPTSQAKPPAVLVTVPGDDADERTMIEFRALLQRLRNRRARR
jgi:hypothetical protein